MGSPVSAPLSTTTVPPLTAVVPLTVGVIMLPFLTSAVATPAPDMVLVLALVIVPTLRLIES